jgi:hypothetical protein
MMFASQTNFKLSVIYGVNNSGTDEIFSNRFKLGSENVQSSLVLSVLQSLVIHTTRAVAYGIDRVL